MKGELQFAGFADGGAGAEHVVITLFDGTEYFKAAGPKLGPCLAGRPEIEYLDGV